jgi:HPt (histidine-containing phosphotransfer) domain-containing protein
MAATARSMPVGAMGPFSRRPAGPAESGEPAIDLAHLSRQTLGDRSLERELLALYDRQAAQIASQLGLPDLSREAVADRLDLAHTLKGSSRAVGAMRVAEACEALEGLLRAGAPESVVESGMRDIRRAVAAARDFIAAGR